ncbi:unnamed protein product [Mycena citricolor]|uniref:Nucleolar protein 9 n=1 Tax=Mycena citricolor TaxID=2018698 RepID=A0AAD2Q6J5_9AGAR|nr:unnamed protein product [Mycena citricolor]
MPKELRKRGKKKKGTQGPPEYERIENPQNHEPETAFEGDAEHGTTRPNPSWIISGSSKQDQVDKDDRAAEIEAPFGYVDADVKAYFRTVDVQMRDWQVATGDGENVDANEGMAGKEKQLATDPDCSIVLERMAYSMDDFVRRVFIDSLIGSYAVLVKHRFASHVCQTLFTVANQTIAREMRGIYPTIPEGDDKGELRRMTELIVDLTKEITPVFTSLLADAFGSHVIRALLVLLSPALASLQDNSHTAVRSKKSAAWKARQGPLKSMFNESRSSAPILYTPPESFAPISRHFIEAVRAELGGNEVRALAADKVASPTLQMLLVVEADQQMSDEEDSLMDRALAGLISHSKSDSRDAPPVSDYLHTLLRDPTASHFLETVVAKCPAPAFATLWTLYFKDSLARLAIHPVANYVLAKTFERLDAAQLADVFLELKGVWGKLTQVSRTGVLRAAIDRSIELKACGPDAVLEAFEINPDDVEQKNAVVPCILRLKSFSDYARQIEYNSEEKGKQKANSGGEMTVQGAVLLQSLLRMADPYNGIVISSLQSLSTVALVSLAHHPAASRVLDALLESKTVLVKSKRQFLLSLIGSYHLLVDDRIGSRVGDRCWANADTYLKEKIARSMIPEERFLAASHFGKFFARNLNLYLLQRRPDDWRNMQSGQRPKATAVQTNPPMITPTIQPNPPPVKKRKRDKAGDEIDQLFEGMGKKIKRGALAVSDHSAHKTEMDASSAVDDVLPQNADSANRPRGKRKGNV